MLAALIVVGVIVVVVGLVVLAAFAEGFKH